MAEHINICPLCGSWPSAGDSVYYYQDLDNSKVYRCYFCYGNHYKEDESDPPVALRDYIEKWGKVEKEGKACEVWVNGKRDFITMEYNGYYRYWIEYKKIEKKHFDGEITAEEAKRQTDELTARILKIFETKRIEVEERCRKGRPKNFWNNHQTFY